jgi:1-aminocyclopropane-1-carboxylate synthase
MSWIDSNFHPYEEISQKDLIITSGATSLLSTLALTLANPSDGVLLPTPCYVAFAPKMQLLAELTPIYVEFPDNVDQFIENDKVLKFFELAVKEADERGVKIKILVLCNPHNPLGRLYTPAALSSLADFCAKHALHLIVDEVYAMSVYTSAPSIALSTSPSNLSKTEFTSILSLAPTSHSLPQSHIHHIYSLSKDFACGGLRIASLYTQNQELQRAVAQLAVLHHSGTINVLLATRLLSSPSWHESFFAASRKKLNTAAKLARGLLDECGVPYAPNDNAGFFLWVDLRAWLVPGVDEREREAELNKRMDKAGVFLVGGMRQGLLEAGWYRFIFSRDEDTLREGVRRLVRALGEKRGRAGV